MLQKWKDILTNWINCYFHESDERQQCVTLESLLNIISHLRENLNLDESKSSVLEAHTVEEFVQEKFPEFRFENGTVEANSEEELYIASSLLLFFVCVNSKDVDLKKAMCSKLSTDDQEFILKFSKCLMECCPVAYKDVHGAIIEACSPETAPMEASSSRSTVSETPPALRSLHGEVRRLQAALDAERFDRNYLQEELARTNLKLEKLSKDKEQCKLEIVNLKAKISMCCGQESDTCAGDAAMEGTAKLMRQLEETEERLVETQGLLDDAQYERDTYKAKINELKQERDKWLTLSQQETARVTQLSEELETERRHVESLRDLLAELRQHHQLNRMDSSQLECDDPDASIHSLAHNSSICSEACANVIEVQLGEERAKIVVLKQNIQSLQEQLSELSHKSESEKLSLERIVSENENVIFNLKHRINEEIEEKNNMTIQYSDDVSKLNNEINELEQKLKDNNNQFRLVVETKMQEIQTLQEEKLSLLQSLTDETTKLENDIKKLKSDLDSEKNLRAKVKEDYENHIMKLNEKILNRNNELVELQNNLCKTSEQSEAIHLELRQEKQARAELVAKYNSDYQELSSKLIQSDSILQRKCEEIDNLVERLNFNFDVNKELNREIAELKYSLNEQNENYRALEATKSRLLEELSARHNKIEELNKNMENLFNVHSEEMDKLRHDLDSASATVNTLQMQLQDELQYKMGLQNELTQLENVKTSLLEEVELLKAELNATKIDLQHKDKTIEGLDLFLKEEKRIKEKLKEDCNNLNEKIKQVTENIVLKTKEIKDIENILFNERNAFEKLMQEKNATIEHLNERLTYVMEEKAAFESEFKKEKETMSIQLSQQSKNISELQEINSQLNNTIAESKNSVQTLQEEKISLLQRLIDETTNLENEIQKLKSELDSEKESKATVKQDCENHMKKSDEELLIKIKEISELRKNLRDYSELIENINLELREEKQTRDELVMKYHHEYEEINCKLIETDNMLQKKCEEIAVLEERLNNYLDINKELNRKVDELKYSLDDQNKKNMALKESTSSLLEELSTRDSKIKELNKNIKNLTTDHTKEINKLSHDLNSALTDVNTLEMQLQAKLHTERDLQNELTDLKLAKTSLQEEMELLKVVLKESKICAHDNGKTIEGLELFIQEEKRTNENLNAKCYDLNEKVKQMTEEIIFKSKEIKTIENRFAEVKNLLEKKIREKDEVIGQVKEKLSSEIQQKAAFESDLRNEKEQITMELSQKSIEISELQEINTRLNVTVEESKKCIQTLQEEKFSLLQSITDETKKMESVIKELKSSLDSEVKSKAKMEEDHENQIKELNEKVLNKTNELFELQNNLHENTEQIELIHSELQREKQTRDELIAKYQNEYEKINSNLMESECMLQRKCQEVDQLGEKLKLSFDAKEELSKGVNDLKYSLSEQNERCMALEETKISLLEELSAKQNKIQELHKNIENLANVHSTETDKLTHDLESALATVNALHMQQQDELKHEKDLQIELAELKDAKTSSLGEVELIKGELYKLKMDLHNKEKTIVEQDSHLEEEKLIIEQLKAECNKSNENIKKMAEEIVCKTKEIKEIENRLTDEKISVVTELREKVEDIKHVNEKLSSELQEKAVLISQLKIDSEKISMELSHKSMHISELQEIITKMNGTIEESKTCIQTLQEEKLSLMQNLTDETMKFENEIKNLKSDLDCEKNCKAKLKEDYENDVYDWNFELNEQILSRNNELVQLQDKLRENSEQIATTNLELVKEKQARDDIIAKYQYEYEEIISKLIQSENVVQRKCEEVDNLVKKLNYSSETTKELSKEVKDLKSSLSEQNNICKNLEEAKVSLLAEVTARNNKIEELQKNIENLSKLRENSEQIATTNLELVKEKQARDDIIAKYQYKYEEINSKLIQSENVVQRKCEEVDNLVKKLNYSSETIKELSKEVEDLKSSLSEQNKICKNLEKAKVSLLAEVTARNNKIEELQKNIENLSKMHNGDKLSKDSDFEIAVNILQTQLQDKLQHESCLQNELAQLKHANTSLLKEVQLLQAELEKSKMYSLDKDSAIERMDLLLKEEKLNNENLKAICENFNEKSMQIAEEMVCKTNEIKDFEERFLREMNSLEKDLLEKNKIIERLNEKLSWEMQEKAAFESELKNEKEKMAMKSGILDTVAKDLSETNATIEKMQAELEAKNAEVNDLKRKLDSVNNEGVMRALRSEEWVKAIAQRETFAGAVSEKTGSHKISGPLEKDYREFLHQVDNTTSDLTHSSMESIKTISDLEKIIYDKNRTITALQSDITYLKSLVADSENKLLDVNRELEDSKENCQQLSSQLKKIVHSKNEEIAELKNKVTKMSATENRVSQIIKVSAKYQAIILKRIAEIKSNTVLKELTNFGNTANGDSDLRRSLNAGTITMEDLENFLETTDKHLKRCSEKQIALQKERDRLAEVNRINESEIINLKKFLSELSISFKTFSTVKDLYAQKFSRVVSVQRTVRREILDLDGRINDATMCKLERGYAAVMQDLTECVMNMERWVERSISRAISPEKIKQAFTGDEDRASFAMNTFQNTGLEVQLEELENSFTKLLEEVIRAQKGEGAKDAQAVTVMEVRAEYEDKLNRMKAKMKQLYQEQISVYKEKQKEEISSLKHELAKTQERMAESSKAYEEHIKALTAELWNVGEKFLTKNDEVEWLRRKQHSGSLMSLQHVHSSGLLPPQEVPPRPSDRHSLRSLPVNKDNTKTNKREGRGLHMSDEEGEVFDNRWLKELSSTPGRPSLSASTPRRGTGVRPSLAASPPTRGTGVRLSELRWRNSLCPPHLKSSYPAETQFAPTFDEEDLKFSLGGASSMGGRNQRKEVGITAYKKPGPPTPSKQAGRLSATDSELRESMRVEGEPAARKTSTPSRLRSLFRSSKNDTAEGTPRSKRLSIFNRKK